jgi:hypothetical protein
MELDDHAEESWWAAESFHDLPHAFSAHCVERFCQVDKGDVESFVLLATLFLELSKDEHHVCSASVCSEATLAFWEVFLGDGRY